MFKYKTLLLLLAAVGLVSFQSDPAGEELMKFYEEHQVQGSFILYDQKNDRYTYYNQEQTNTPFTPASTFKICNSLIALETGAVKDEHTVSKWDQKERPVPAWNADTDMRNAFKNSTVWFYQELAKRVGEEKMKFWLKKANYGNGDISGGIDGFWLWGGLRITPAQQIDFLRNLHQNLHVSWYVGYITTANNVYYFSNCIQTKDKKEDFKKAGVSIAINVLDNLKVINKQDWDN